MKWVVGGGKQRSTNARYNFLSTKESPMIGPEIYQRIDRLDGQLGHLRGYL